VLLVAARPPARIAAARTTSSPPPVSPSSSGGASWSCIHIVFVSLFSPPGADPFVFTLNFAAFAAATAAQMHVDAEKHNERLELSF
jgi:hypothetical protein